MATFGVKYFTCYSINTTRCSLRTIQHTVTVSSLRDKPNLIAIVGATHLHSYVWRLTGRDKINKQDARNCPMMPTASIGNSANTFKKNNA
jgi:hypothetical protein